MIHEKFDCEFYLIRHGESESNAEPGLIAGRHFDSELTPRGIAQARLLGERLARQKIEFDRVYSSTYQRAAKTARIMVEAMGTSDVPVVEVYDLREHETPPDWRGKTGEEVLTSGVRAYMAAKGYHFTPPGGETPRMVQRRVSHWLEDEILYNSDLIEQPVSMTIAIVGHGTATRCLMQYILGFDQRMLWRMALDNCSISRFRFNREGWSLLTINDSLHIKDLAG